MCPRKICKNNFRVRECWEKINKWRNPKCDRDWKKKNWKINEKQMKKHWKRFEKKMQLEKGNRSPYRKGGIKVQKEYAKTKCDVKNSNS